MNYEIFLTSLVLHLLGSLWLTLLKEGNLFVLFKISDVVSVSFLFTYFALSSPVNILI